MKNVLVGSKKMMGIFFAVLLSGATSHALDEVGLKNFRDIYASMANISNLYEELEPAYVKYNQNMPQSSELGELNPNTYMASLGFTSQACDAAVEQEKNSRDRSVYVGLDFTETLENTSEAALSRFHEHLAFAFWFRDMSMEEETLMLSIVNELKEADTTKENYALFMCSLFAQSYEFLTK